MPKETAAAETHAILSSVTTIGKSVDKLSTKIDGITTMVMSMSNEIARLDERLTFTLEQQKNHTAELTDIKQRLAQIENYDSIDGKNKDVIMRVFLIILSAIATGIFMHFG